MLSIINIEELIARPLDVIARLRAELKARDINGGGGEGGDLLAAAIADALCSGASPSLERVPVLCRESLAEGKLAANSLVRYRGMVQDQYEPEYFVGSFEEVETATGGRRRVDVKYVDSIAQKPGFVNEYDGPGSETMDRLPLYCIPVPGQSRWAIPPNTAREAGGGRGAVAAAVAGGVPKRQRETADGAGGVADAMDCTDGAVEAGNSNDGPQPKALRATGGDGSGAAAEAPPQNGGSGSGSGSASGSASSAFYHEQELELDGLACVVKVYDFREGQVKLNETVEFVGVLGYDRAALVDEGSASAEKFDGVVSIVGGEGGAGEQQQQQQRRPVPSSAAAAGVNPFQGLEDFSRKVPPPSLAPRLHCVFHRKLAPCAPLTVDPVVPQDALHASRGKVPFGAFMRDARRKAIAHLAQGLRGDALAAEYALLALLSRAYVRTESLAPGSLSLNLRGISPSEAPVFYAAVSDLVPKCVKIPITTKSLSEQFKFAPKKDYEADRLMMSGLQLSDGTVVLLDETGLAPGQVGTEGVANLAALTSLASLQKVPYDFGFYKMDFEVDHPTISLSLRESVVPTGAAVPVVAAAAEDESDGGASGETFPGSEGEGVMEEVAGAPPAALLLSTLRVYIEATRRTELSLDEKASALAEDDFVKARQQGQSITGEDFHRMLTIARLTALSLGDSAMTEEHWTHMKDLEARVAGRVRRQATAGDGVAAATGTSIGSSSGVRCAGAPPGRTIAGTGATPVSPGEQVGPLNAIPGNE